MKIFKILLFFVLFFIVFSVNAKTPVENIFKDINKNYIYHDELQLLYDKGIFFPDKNGNFSPNATLTRSEFVGIVQEISCKECIAPDVDISLVQKYSNKEIFFDVSQTDKNFYCIADAVDNEIVFGYQAGTVCQNGVSKAGQKPFCPGNQILLEEALAIILRTSNILPAREAEMIRNQIAAGVSFPTLNGGISPTLGDGSVYSFYPDFKVASEYVFIDYDKNGVEKRLKFLDFSKPVNPKQIVTREEFLRMSYIAFKNNACRNKYDNKNDFGLEIEILDKTCNPTKTNCKKTNFPLGEKIYDLNAKISEKDNGNYTYNWRIYDYSTGEETVLIGKYIDDYNFTEDGKYRVYLTVTSTSGEVSEVYTDIKITDSLDDKNKNNSDLGFTSYITVDKNPIKSGETVTFTGHTTSGKDGNVTYIWDFGDGTTGTGKDIKHKYDIPGTYTVTLIVKDENGNTSTSTMIVQINDDFTSTIEVDKDGGNATFTGNTTGGSGDKNDYTYTWDFGDGGTGTGQTTDHTYDKDGDYTVGLTVTDGDGNTTTTTTTVTITGTGNGGGFTSTIEVDKDGGDVTFTGNTTGGRGDKNDYTYTWDFGDGGSGNGQQTEHTYDKDGDYTVGLTVTDGDGNTTTTTTTVTITGTDKDSDGDGVSDRDDLCPIIPGPKENFGCPIFNKKCREDKDCKDGYYCDADGYCKIKKYSLNCYYNGFDLINGNLLCQTCPCQYKFDFKASLRNCDVIFPSITSTDFKYIYGKGNFYQIKIEE